MKGDDQPQATTLTNPLEIQLYRLKCARSAIKLEKLGLRHSRIRIGVRGLWAKHYGLSPRAKHDEVVAKIDEEIQQLTEKLNEQRQQRLPL